MGKVIGICGFIGSGKGTVGDILVEEHGFKKISFADRLKDVVCTLFDWDRTMIEGDTPESRQWREQPDDFWSQELGQKFSPRNAMQRVGTDAIRKEISQDIWTLIVKKAIAENPDADWVVPDVRFQNERQMIQDLSGSIWWVKRGPDPEWVASAIADNKYQSNNMLDYPTIHESEWRWLDYDFKFDAIIHNNESLTELKSTTNALVNKLGR